MREHKYDYEAHVEIHAGFIKRYEEFKKRLLRGKALSALAVDVRIFLGDWWFDHIKTVDKKYYQYITKHPKSHPVDEPEDYHDKIQDVND